MKITALETFLTNAGLRNYLFVRLATDSGMHGIGEASLEWQERAVEALLHDWVRDRVIGADPFDIEAVVGAMLRDQYQGGATITTAISGVEIAMWDLVGKACGQPVYKLLGGRAHERVGAYANGWYGGAGTPELFANKAREVVARGYRAMKFDPFGTAWKRATTQQMRDAETIVAAVREAVGPEIELHGRLSIEQAIAVGRRLARYQPAWYEEPVTPNSLDLLQEVKNSLPFPIAAGERLYTLEEFGRLCAMRAADVVQMDPAHCGGLSVAKKVAAIAEANDLCVSPHVSIGPVALCAALHLDWSTKNFRIQENFSEYDVPWRNELVRGWDPMQDGFFQLPAKPGLGIELDIQACAAHPFRQNSFPSLWDEKWLKDFTQNRNA